jgi:thiol-disulfide isomerase/thioredoxin
MRRLVAVVSLALVCLVASMICMSVVAADEATKAAAAPPADRTIVMYFHRTQRCPTCRKMGSYAEEAVKKGFANQLKAGKVEFHFIDFQEEKNAELTKGYKVSGPTLIVAKVVGGQVSDYKNLSEIWDKAGDKAAFIEYVQSNVKESLTRQVP